MNDPTPPPFFKTGLPPHLRFTIFVLLSAVLMLADARLTYLGALRQALAVFVNPLQHAVNAPVRLAGQVADFFVTHSRLRLENEELRQTRLRLSAQLLELEALRAENAHLRALLDARPRYGHTAQLAQILYAERDPFSRKIIIDRGSLHHVEAGQVVVDETGVVGQVTRAYPAVAEVTLITDKNQAVPVQNLRNGLRAVVFGSGQDGTLNVPFMPTNADLVPGDQLVTSGLDGIYPPGLPVATVVRVERNAAYPFARIACLPAAGVDRHRHVLVLRSTAPPPPRPPAEVARGKR
jgi:rod shape-determining protein MreC